MTCDELMKRSNLTISFTPCEYIVNSANRRESSSTNTVHVWGCSLEASDGCLETCRGWLDADEQTRATRLIHEQDRRRYVLAHGTLRALLSRYVCCSPRAIRFGRETVGKPFLIIEDNTEPVTFSLAHSHNRLVIAVTRRDAIGIDLERIRPTADVIKLADRFYRPAERARIADFPAREQMRQFFRYWVAKEAVLKGEGLGIASLQDCEVLFEGQDGHASVQVLDGQPPYRPWAVQLLSCGPTWEGAVAVRDARDVQAMTL